jgi:hypothetical protein
MFGNIINSVFGMFWDLLKFPLLIVGVFILIFLAVYAGNVFYFVKFKGCKTTGTEHYRPQKENLFKVLWYGIRQAAYDRSTRNIEFIPEGWTGLICFEGMPGAGKTTTAVWDTILKRSEYPKMKVYSNMDITFQDGSIDNWKQLMEYNNDEFGQVYVLDELSSLLNSRSFKDFPPDALDLITQSRKIRTRICYTTQDFQMVDINLRRLTKEVWKPITLLRTICFVLKYQPKVNSEGKVEKMKFKGITYYRHTEELRNCFDTRKQIGRIKKEGFAPREKQIRATEPTTNNIQISNKKRR